MLNTPYLPNWPTRLTENLKEWITSIRQTVYDDWLELQKWVIARIGEATDLIDADITAIEGDITTLQGDITSLDGRVTTLEGSVPYPSKEDLSGIINGVNTSFALSADHSQIILIVNGAVLHTPGDYTRAGVNITLTVAPATGYVWCFYWS